MQTVLLFGRLKSSEHHCTVDIVFVHKIYTEGSNILKYLIIIIDNDSLVIYHICKGMYA